MSPVLFDVNVWVALAFSTHPRHAQAKATFAKAYDIPVITLDADFQNFEDLEVQILG